jgi:Zinc finger, C3HC4 type (RING finger)
MSSVYYPELELLPRTKNREENAALEFDQSHFEDISRELQCPICMDVMSDVAVTECLHRFCRECIRKHLERIGSLRECPSCRVKITSTRNLR